jgi:hypothetical protein
VLDAVQDDIAVRRARRIPGVGAAALVQSRRGRPIRLWSLAFRRGPDRTAGTLPVAAPTQAPSFSPT